MNTADKPIDREAEDAAWDAEMTAKDPRFPARKAASLALDKYVREWIDGYELDDGEVNHTPTELESFLIYDAFAGLSEDEEYLALRAAWKSLCGPVSASLVAPQEVRMLTDEEVKYCKPPYILADRHGLFAAIQQKFAEVNALPLSPGDSKSELQKSESEVQTAHPVVAVGSDLPPALTEPEGEKRVFAGAPVNIGANIFTDMCVPVVREASKKLNPTPQQLGQLYAGFLAAAFGSMIADFGQQQAIAWAQQTLDMTASGDFDNLKSARAH